MVLGGIPEVLSVEEKLAPSAWEDGGQGEPRISKGKPGQGCGSELKGLVLTGGVGGNPGEQAPAWESSVALRHPCPPPKVPLSRHWVGL